MYVSVITNTFSQMPNVKYTTVNNINFVTLVPLYHQELYL